MNEMSQENLAKNIAKYLVENTNFIDNIAGKVVERLEPKIKKIEARLDSLETLCKYVFENDKT